MAHNLKVALFGNVNTEEVLADRLVGEGATVDGFLLHPNFAFQKKCRRSVVLSKHSDKFREETVPHMLLDEGYDVVLLGPDFMSHLMSPVLRKHGIPHIGATPEQLRFETDKTLIARIFPAEMEILPRRVVLTSTAPDVLFGAIDQFDHGYVIKFVGDYQMRFKGSPAGRVRFSDDLDVAQDELAMFVRESIIESGHCVIEERVSGREFSANYLVDGHGGKLRLGENICYKRRGEGNTGPLCDGTGSVSFNNTLPFLTAGDIAFIEEKILTPFIQGVEKATGSQLVAFLNLDLMKRNDGRIVLFEINVREAGGHTMSTIVPGLTGSLSNILFHTQRGTLSDCGEQQFSGGAAIAVSAYPSYFPLGISEGDKEQVVTFSTDRTDPAVSLFSGWVDVLDESLRTRTVRAHNSPILLFACHAEKFPDARKRLYSDIERVVAGQLDFRGDIGGEFLPV